MPGRQVGLAGALRGAQPGLEQRRLPPAMWRAYVDACVALAEGLGKTEARPERPLGFRK